MNAHNLRIWAEIQSILVTVRGMEAENAWREQCGKSVAYDGESFDRLAEEIYQLSHGFSDVP